MEGTIHHIELYVSDLKKSITFWEWLLTRKFNYQIFQKWDAGISFKLANAYIVLVQTEKKYRNTPYNRKNTGLNHLAFHCNSRSFVDILTEELKEKNIPILYMDRHPFAGGKDYYAVFFEDPDRIKIEVVASND